MERRAHRFRRHPQHCPDDRRRRAGRHRRPRTDRGRPLPLPKVPEDALRCRFVAPGAGHFSLFHGGRWRREVMPQLKAFMIAAEMR